MICGKRSCYLSAVGVVRPSPNERDQRRWTTYRVALPREGVAELWEEARELMRRFLGVEGEAPVIEAIAQEIISTLAPMVEAQREELSQTAEGRFRLAVLERDGWKCLLCGARKALQVHHIVPRAHCSGEKMVDPGNGATLCARCHSVITLARETGQSWQGMEGRLREAISA